MTGARPGGRFGACFEGIPRPEVIVPISGCHFAYAGNTLGFEKTAGRTPRLTSP